MHKLLKMINGDAVIGIILSLFLGYVALTSTGSLMTKLGFDTKDNLKTQLVNAEKNLSICYAELANKHKVIAINERNCRMKTQITDKFIQDSLDIDKLISSVLIRNKTHETTPPVKEETISSGDEIVIINNLYDNLFGS